MNATGVYYGGWINGNSEVFQLRLEPNLFEELPRLPAVNETLDDVKVPITRAELQPVHDLKQEIEYLEDAVLANAGVSAFDEIFKLIFAKLYDEYTKGDSDPMDFRTTTASPAEQYKRLNGIFHAACEEWPDIFAPSEKIELTPEALIAVASAFQTKRFFDADLDVIDAAFEYMINPEQKGDKGQYFTPRPVVKMCVKMLNPQDEKILDPACGPGGFLIHSLNWVNEIYLKPKFGANLAKKKIDYATSRLFGIDFDPRLMRVAKAMMLMAGDGRTNIFRVNTLDPREWQGRTDGLAGAITDGDFGIVLTNPPFAGSITQPEILGGFNLAYKGDPTKNKRLGKQTRDILFLERCLRFLKPGGRMAIVLPQGNLNNTSTAYLRTWLAEQARILAVIGLHQNTFKPFTGTKTSVVVLQRWKSDEEPTSDYPIFMAVNRKPVKDTSGNYIFKRAPSGGGLLTDSDGKPVIDHDLDEIAEEFIAFAKANGFGFWS
jgi:type I restriction enzyme M protein